jgi:hypothetical protein
MAKINITGGSYPRQQAFIEYGKIFIRDADGKKLVYTNRAAIEDLYTVSEGRKDRTIKITLRDGNVIICNVPRNVYDELYQEMVTGPRAGDTVVAPITISQQIARNMLQYMGGIILIFLVGLCTIKNSSPDDRNRIPYAEREKIEQMYYEVTGNPNMPEAMRKRYACSKSGDMAEYYRGRGDNTSADEWREINRRECRY